MILKVKKMSTTTIKEEAQKMIDNLPEDVSWDDIMYQIYVRQSINAGLKDSENNNTYTVAEVREKYGLK